LRRFSRNVVGRFLLDREGSGRFECAPHVTLEELLMLKDLKDKALRLGMDAMDTDAAKKMMGSAEFQKVVMKAFQTSFKVRQDLNNAKKVVAKRLNVATGDDLKEMKRTIDRLERRVKNLKDDNDRLKATVERKDEE